jgi:hypothetical protein
VKVHLYEACYRMRFGCGKDHWTLFGKVFNHPNHPDGHQVHTSTPVEFDEESVESVTYI